MKNFDGAERSMMSNNSEASSPPSMLLPPVKQVDVGEREKWREMFDRRMKIEIEAEDGKFDVFNIYTAGNVFNNLLLCLHGGGSSATSWALMTRLIKHAFFVVAYDCRSHGFTECQNEENLNFQQLVEDGVKIISKIRKFVDDERGRNKSSVEKGVSYQNAYREQLSHSTAALISVREKILRKSRENGVPIVLMGHSLGGATAIRLAASNRIPNLQGLIVLDTVEGVAIEALPKMEEFLSRFPSSFQSERDAVEWSLKSVLKNRRSAEISIPSQIYFNEKSQNWQWKVDLTKTRNHWRGWFEGITKDFLSCKVGSGGKLLVLASGADRLDKDLMIAHMQGKYQLEVIRRSGHVIHEDQPADVAQVVLQFGQRYQLIEEQQTEEKSSSSSNSREQSRETDETRREQSPSQQKQQETDKNNKE